MQHPLRSSVVGFSLLALCPTVQAQVVEALEGISQNPTQRAISGTIGVICPSGNITSPDLQARCTEVVVEALGVGTGDVAGAAQGLQAMAPEEDAVLGSMQVDAGQGHVDTVQARVANIRAGGASLAATDLSLDGRALASTGLRGMSAGGGSGGWGAFVNGSFSTGDRDTTTLESGFDFDSFSITGGIDYMPSPTMVFGVAAGFMSSSADLVGNGGDIDSDGYTLLGYASFFPNSNAYVDASLSYSDTDHDQSRAVRYTVGATSVDQSALSSTDSTDWAFRIQGGYDWFRDRLSYGVYARAEYARTEIDGFQESMSSSTALGNGLALIIDDQSFTSVPLTLGLRASHSYSFGSTTLFPEIYGEYTHEFDNDNKPVVARFVSDPTNNRFALPTDEPDRDYFTLGFRTAATFGGGTSAYVLYETLLGHSQLSNHTIEAGLKLTW